MILIPVDPGYAFDYLAILEIKQQQKLATLESIREFSEVIKSQIGSTLFNEIKCSNEYKNIRKANVQTFIIVDEAKANRCNAKDVQDANFKRYEAKIALQKRFFQGKELVEKKN